MFSNRFSWNFELNRLSRALEARRQEGSDLLDLTESNPTRAELDYPEDVARAFSDPAMFVYEPSPAGLRSAREAVALYYATHGCAVDIGDILLTASTSEAYSYLFKLLCSPGDEVLVPRPSYPLFDFLARLESVEIRQYPLVYHGGWAIDMQALASAMTDRTRAVVLVNPNNPTGSYLKRQELEFWMRLQRHDLALICDEVFSDYAFSPDADRVSNLALSAARNECLLFSLSGLSKTAGLPQMKLGWIVAGGPPDLRKEAVGKLEWIADTYLSVSTPVQCAAARLLNAGASIQQQIRARTSANLSLAREILAGSAASILAVEGGWYITIQVPRIRGEEDWALELLNRKGVLVQPGFFFDFDSEAFLVASLLTPPAFFREGLTRLRELLG